MADADNVSVLFVCMGNICRSPTAEAVFRHLVNQAYLDFIDIDSAGTHAYHVGESPDRRAIETAKQHKVNMDGIYARQVSQQDFEEFDLILAMDSDNLTSLKESCPQQYQHKLKKMLDYHDQPALSNVPDPYYGGSFGFEKVYKLVHNAAENLLKELIHSDH